MKAQKSKAEKAIDTAIERAYYVIGDRRQINIMDIGKLYADARRDILAGVSVIEAVTRGVEKYCAPVVA